MRLKDLEIFVVAPPAPRLGWALLDFPKTDHRNGSGRLRRMLCHFGVAPSDDRGD